MKGTVVYLYAFDVAFDIRTSQIREVLSEKPFPFQIRMGTTAPRDLRVSQPLTIGMRPEDADSNVGRLTLKPFVKIYDIGVISISYEVAVDVPTLHDLVPYHRVIIGDRTLDRRAEALLQQVVKNIAPYMIKPNPEPPVAEAYTVFCLENLDGARPGAVEEWAQAQRREIAALLTEEAVADRLSEDQVRETMRNKLSYTGSDLTIVDWDAALVVDQSGYYDDVLFVIELANLELEEFKLLDDRLDQFFLAAYDDLERYYSRLILTPRRILRSLRSIRIDYTKMSEETTNITKFVGDWYLARVYLACKERFHLGHWESSVDQKLAQLDALYSIVVAEINGRRALLLEGAIVALFVLDILMLIFAKK